ncbi:hypothetical protein WJX73_005792 [Symbiochloris irregularis]|uniref:Uncharacterized protein n=1 Tax=Symbiochloris irregularis TaxID=706552 RepID=A0AAW1P1N2_9CHLO
MAELHRPLSFGGISVLNRAGFRSSLAANLVILVLIATVNISIQDPLPNQDFPTGSHCNVDSDCKGAQGFFGNGPAICGCNNDMGCDVNNICVVPTHNVGCRKDADCQNGGAAAAITELVAAIAFAA